MRHTTNMIPHFPEIQAGCPVFLFAKSSRPHSKDSNFDKEAREVMIL